MPELWNTIQICEPIITNTTNTTDRYNNNCLCVRSLSCSDNILALVVGDGRLLSANWNNMNHEKSESKTLRSCEIIASNELDNRDNHDVTVHFKHVACGLQHVAAVDVLGHFFIADVPTTTSLPTLSMKKMELSDGDCAGSTVIDVACGAMHTLILTTTGEVYACGSGVMGVLGLNGVSSTSIPMRIGALNGLMIVYIACGWDYSLAITDDGRLFTWGSSSEGQLGLGNCKNVMLPTFVPSSDVFVRIAAGDGHSAALTKNHQLLVWGGGADGQLIKDTDELIPTVVGMSEVGENILDVACGLRHTTCLTRELGTIIVFGNGEGVPVKICSDGEALQGTKLFTCFGRWSVGLAKFPARFKYIGGDDTTLIVSWKVDVGGGAFAVVENDAGKVTLERISDVDGIDILPPATSVTATKATKTRVCSLV